MPSRPPPPFEKIPKMRFGKGPMLRRMDRLAADPFLMRAALHALEEHPGRSMLEIGRTHEYVAGSEEERHVRDDWFDAERGWFRGYGPVEPVLRAGLIQAARAALENKEPLPVDCYWYSGHHTIEVAILRGPRQVTMILMTPPPQLEAAAEPGESEEGIWTVRARSDAPGGIEITPRG